MSRYQPTDMSILEARDFLAREGYYVEDHPLVWNEWSPRPRVERRRREARQELAEERPVFHRLMIQMAMLDSELRPITERETAARSRMTRIRELLQELRTNTSRLNRAHQRLRRGRGDTATASNDLAEATATLSMIANTTSQIEHELSITPVDGTLRTRLQRAYASDSTRRREGSRQRRQLENTRRRVMVQFNTLHRSIRENQQMLADVPPDSLNNPDAVRVNLAGTGVNIRYRPNRGIRSHWNIDPVFAVAVVRFMLAARSQLGVTDIYTNGFTRDQGPMSPRDTHPQGSAWDVHGFQVVGTDLLLRSGHLVEFGHPDFEQDHSDWFDNVESAGGLTHEEQMRRFVNLMPDYFGQVIGPGANAEHMNHFHVQLVGYSGRGGAISCPATRANPTQWARPRRVPPPDPQQAAAEPHSH